jgi:heat shock protein HspQ
MKKINVPVKTNNPTKLKFPIAFKNVIYFEDRYINFNINENVNSKYTKYKSEIEYIIKDKKTINAILKEKLINYKEAIFDVEKQFKQITDIFEEIIALKQSNTSNEKYFKVNFTIENGEHELPFYFMETTNGDGYTRKSATIITESHKQSFLINHNTKNEVVYFSSEHYVIENETELNDIIEGIESSWDGDHSIINKQTFIAIEKEYFEFNKDKILADIK